METRKIILETTFQLIGKHGYEKTSTAMICKAVGITKPSLYYYFESKEELFLELINEFLNGDKAVPFNMDVTEEEYFIELTNFGLGFLSAYKRDEIFSNFAMEVYIQSKRITELSRQMSEYNRLFKSAIGDILLRGVELGLIEEDELSITTETMYATIHGIEASIMFGTDINHEVVWMHFVDNLGKR